MQKEQVSYLKKPKRTKLEMFDVNLRIRIMEMLPHVLRYDNGVEFENKITHTQEEKVAAPLSLVLFEIK